MAQALVIVGGGPAALAPLFAAATTGALEDLLNAGVTLLEQSESLGAGGLRTVTVDSDSPAEAFLDILVNSQQPELRALQSHPVAIEIATHSGASVPLPLASQLLDNASAALLQIVAAHPSCEVITGSTALSARRRNNGQWDVVSVDGDGHRRMHRAHSVHLATGANQPTSRLETEPVAGEPLLPRYAEKVMQTGELFTRAGASRLHTMLAGKVNPRVVIVGGSTSAGAAAVYLLRQSGIAFGERGVTIMHRSPLRLFYASVADAHADGYREFCSDDVCPITGRVFRLAGFRFASKDLLRNAFHLDGTAPDARLRLYGLNDRDGEAQHLLEKTDVVIAALGYIPRMLTVLDEGGDVIDLHVPARGDWSMVDHTSTVLTRHGLPLPGLTAMGLAVGPAASREFGGEANFHGQVNSLWMWQNRLGKQVVDSALQRVRSASIPLLCPAPPRLSEHAAELQTIEDSNIYTNFGPVNTRFERDLVDTLFAGQGACLTTCNATLALMLAIKNAAGEDMRRQRYALMPSFTFAAAAQAALWCGLTPLFCDIDADTWLPCHESQQALLQLFGEEIAVIVPNATFGNTLDLAWYERLQQTTGIPVVVDAAACLGSLDSNSRQFGTGSQLPIIFSMHATKCFATGEGGVVYSEDTDLLDRLRTMSSFGFGESRVATMPGLNAKLSEVAALTASLQLKAFPRQVEQREQVAQWYEAALDARLVRQTVSGRRKAHAFQSILLPHHAASARETIQASLLANGVQTGRYFSPHLAQQTYFQQRSECPALPVSDGVASRILSLPISAATTRDQVRHIAASLANAVDAVSMHSVAVNSHVCLASESFERAS